MTTTSRAKPSTFGKLISATTKDGKMLPVAVIASKGLVGLALLIFGLFAAGLLLIFLMANPVIPALIGGAVAAYLYLRVYGTSFPPAAVDALKRRRVTREGSAAPQATAAERGAPSRSDRQLNR